MVVLLSVLALVGVVILYAVLLYNDCVRGKNLVGEAWSGIEVQLKLRRDLIPNLVDVVRQYAAHERSLFEEISVARVRSMSVTGDVTAQARAETVLSGTLRGLFAVAEAYPELKANTNYLQLQENLAGLEDEIQIARRYYNEAASEQNNRVQQFPCILVASLFRFGRAAFFELENLAEKTVPDVGVLTR